MASATGRGDAGGSRREILSARDLPTRRILGKGLASIGYETELEGKRLARIEFRGVPSGIFEKEAAVLVNLKDHENIVKTHNWTVDKMSCSLVLEHMEGNLLDLLQRRKDQSNRSLAQPAFTLQEALGIMWQIARGMENLHEQDVLHGDLKTNNILVSARLNNGESGSESDSLVSVKVADFGLGRTKRKSIPFVSRQARKLDMVRWKAPECLQKLLSHLAEDNDETSDEDSDSDEDQPAWGSSGDTDSLQFRADVYSFALTCFQILTGEDPYPGLNWKVDVPGIVMGNLRPTLPASCPELLKELLVSCWHKDPDQRPKSFSNIRTTLELLNAPNPELLVYTENSEESQGRRLSLYQGTGASSFMPNSYEGTSAQQSVVDLEDLAENRWATSRPGFPDSIPLDSMPLNSEIFTLTLRTQSKMFSADQSVELPSDRMRVVLRLKIRQQAEAIKSDLQLRNLGMACEVHSENGNTDITVSGYAPSRNFTVKNVVNIIRGYDPGAEVISTYPTYYSKGPFALGGVSGGTKSVSNEFK